ncbi:MAG: hypothetical protein HY842_18610 [Bacteroidetes bacterium]|nr:hypothetical protein [Bacteroidota bacterium]
MEDDKWGVYARPNPASGIDPTTNTITGSGQVTVVMPLNFTWSGLTSVSGAWTANAPVHGPVENPTKSYISFGFVGDVPQIQVQAGQETLLFTFLRDEACPDSMYLIDNDTDPFNVLPNSMNSNPGNEITMFDAGVGLYSYIGLYSPSAWSCHDCDGDGILNGLEDTDGDGTYDGVWEDVNNNDTLDAGEDLDGDGYLDPDISQLCNPCDPFHPESAAMELIGGADIICANDLGDTAYFKVNIVGGWPPYTVNYTDGTDTFAVAPYYSGDSIWFVPTQSVILDLVSIIDSFGCLLDTALTGGIAIEVQGPISVTDEPDPVTECSGNGTSFCIATQNLGDGTVYKKWQVNTGSGWVDIQDGAQYDDTDSLCVNVVNVAGKHGYQYRCKIFTSHCDTVYSAGALLQVEGPLTVTTHPSDYVNCDSETATFSAVAANGGAVGTMSYVWQVNTGSGWADLANGVGPGGATYSTVTTTTVNLSNIDILMDGWQYRMRIYTGECANIFTNAATLDIEGPITVTNDPDDVSNCAGSEVYFISEFSNPGAASGSTTISYIWQVNDGSGWVNLDNNSGVYAGIIGLNNTVTGSDTLTITNVLGLEGYQYRIVYTSATCSVLVPSGAATLSVSGNVTFSDHPDDITVCSGSDTLFVADASIPQGSFYYGWQYSNDAGATWNDITLPSGVFTHSEADTIGSGTDTLFLSDVAGMYEYRFRSVAYATDCDSVVSNEARLHVEGPLSVSDDPDDITACSGNPVLFQATIANPGVTGSTQYQWQIQPFGSGVWTNLSNSSNYGGVYTSTMIVSDISGLHGARFRLRAGTSTCNDIFTNYATLTVEGPVTITQANQPDDVTLCSDDAATFTSIADVGTSGTLSYQWQVSSDNGTNWSNIGAGTDGGVYTNFTTTTLSISSVAGLYNRSYRLRFTTGSCAAVYSNKASLNIEGPLTIADQPDDVTECSGDPVLFGIDILNSSLDFTTDNYINYQWQESTDGGSTWANIVDGIPFGGNNTDTLLISDIVGKDDNQYRVLIWSEHCDTLTSDAATLFVEGPVTFVDEPDNITECSGSGVTFQATTANPGLGTILYQWEVSADSGATWTNIANGGTNGYSGIDATTLNITDVVDLYGERFRLKAWTATCDTIWSNYAVLTVEGPIDFTDQPDAVTECSGSSVTFEVTTANTGQGAITYQWQVSPAGSGGPWFNINNNSTYGGTKTSHLSISSVAGFNGYCYRVLIQTSTCPAVASDPACLTVEGPISVTDHPDDITQCSLEGVSFTGAGAIAVGNSGTLTYQWQASSDNGLNWVNLTNTAPYSDVTTATMSIANVAGLNGWRYRLAIRTTECNPVYTNFAVLNVEGPLNVVEDPIDLTNCSDKEALFTAELFNPGVGGINYQWQQSTDGGTTWNYIYDGTVGANIFAGTSSDTILISPIVGLNGTMYRLQGWTGTCDTVTTAEVILNVEGPISFTDQPDDVTLCALQSTSFTIAIDNATGVGTVLYQWQVSTVSGTWSNLANTSPYSGAFTNTLNISNVSGLYNRKYRCGVKLGNCEWTYSDLAQLFVEGPITISLQPVDAAVCSNIGHIFNTTVTNPGSGAMTYQWQVSANSGSTWSNLNNGTTTVNSGTYQGTKTQDLNISLVEGMNGYMFRLIIRTSTCNDTSNEVVLSVLDACLTGTCDFDLDGVINDTDDDDDNDQLADYWEDWMTVHNTLDGWNYLDSNGDTLFYDRCLTDTDGDGIFDNQEDPDGDAINNGEETDGDGIFDGNPLDPCDPILGPTCVGINLAIKVRLQGAVINVSSSDTLMRASLRSYGTGAERLIPTQEPYEDMTSFAHVGSDGGGDEVVVDSTAVFAVTTEDAIVDWVFVELRSSTALDSVATTRSGLLQRDGDVVDVDGVSPIHFPSANAGAYYVAVRHRNHLGVMSGEAVELSPIVQELDFTDPSFVTSGAYAQVQINGRMCMWAGDLNADGRTVYQGPGNDVLKLFTTVLFDPGNTTLIANFISEGYLEADVDLNGRAIYQGPLNDRSMLLLNTILSHPANVNLISNYVILETLP